ncbi:coiled-coil domain-containing protein [Sphaerisporangium rhizosphaerae]|uniref:Cell division protein DivIVA n=1 Tax=Sphaerisporangium rhizosphaerae TaxID=2269375 RepID=A0ABW2P5E2_9ACTN
MTNQHDSFPDMMHEDLGFEVVMRGYSRRQVHDHMVRTRNQIRDLEERLARAIDQAEQGRVELAEARRRLAEAPQDYDELGQRLSQILKLAEEEAISKRETADTEAAKVREEAAAEAERILTAAQAEAERRVAEATNAAERLLAQAGSDAEETLGAARAESDETLRNARAEADRALTAAQHEAERLVSEANAQAEATLGSAKAESEATLKAARERAASLDEHTGTRVTFLTDTHTEVMRRLNEMGSVLTDLLRREGNAGALIDEAAVLPPAPSVGSAEDLHQSGAPAAEEIDAVRVVLDDADGPDGPARPGGAAEGEDAPAGHESAQDGSEGAGEHDKGDERHGRDEGGLGAEQGPAAEQGPRDVFASHSGPQDAFAPHGGSRGGLAGHRGDDQPEDAVFGRPVFDADGGVRDAQQSVQVAAGDDDAHDARRGNDHETPKGRIRGFFEDSDVHSGGGHQR